MPLIRGQGQFPSQENHAVQADPFPPPAVRGLCCLARPYCALDGPASLSLSHAQIVERL
jgi:hypothetical protein